MVSTFAPFVRVHVSVIHYILCKSTIPHNVFAFYSFSRCIMALVKRDNNDVSMVTRVCIQDFCVVCDPMICVTLVDRP